MKTMSWSLLIWTILCLISTYSGWILGRNRFIYQNNKQTCLFSTPNKVLALPTLLEYNGTASEQLFFPFPGAENISVQVLRGRNNDRFVPTRLAQSLSPQQRWQYWENRRKAEEQLKSAIMRNELPKNLVPYFKNYRKYTELEISEVLQMNHDFFRALSEADVDKMKKLWAEAPETLCHVSQSGDFISGYDNIITYLSKTLEKSTTVKLENATVHFMGDVAIVTSEIETVIRVEESKKKKESKSSSPLTPRDVMRGFGSNIYTVENNKLVPVQGQGSTKDGNKKYRKAFAYVYNIFRRSPVTQRYQLLMHYGSVVNPQELYAVNLYRDPTSPYMPAEKPRLNLLDMMRQMRGGEEGDDEDDEDDEDEDEDDEVEYEDEEEDGEDEDDEDDDDETIEYDNEDYNEDEDDDEEEEESEEDDDGDKEANDQDIINKIDAVKSDGSFSADEKRLLDSFQRYIKENQQQNSKTNKKKEVPVRKSLINYDQEGRPVGGVLIIRGNRIPGSPDNVIDKVKSVLESIRMGKVGNNNINADNKIDNNRLRIDGGGSLVRISGSNDANGPNSQGGDNNNDENDNLFGLLAGAKSGEASLSWRAIASVRWLHSQGRLSDLEKQVLTTSVIDKTQKKHSKLEIAHALLFFDLDLTKSSYNDVKDAFAKIKPEDVADFETVCHAIAEELQQEKQLISPYPST